MFMRFQVQVCRQLRFAELFHSIFWRNDMGYRMITGLAVIMLTLTSATFAQQAAAPPPADAQTTAKEKWESLSKEEKDKLRAEFKEKAKEKWESMTPEEREAAKTKMKEKAKEKWEKATPEQKEQMKKKMREQREQRQNGNN